MRYLCLLIGEPDIEAPVPGTPEFAQMLSDFESATLRVRDGRPLVTDGPARRAAARSWTVTPRFLRVSVHDDGRRLAEPCWRES